MIQVTLCGMTSFMIFLGMQAIEQALAQIRSSTKCACSDGQNSSDIVAPDDFCRFDYGYTFSVAIANRMALSEEQLYDADNTNNMLFFQQQRE